MSNNYKYDSKIDKGFNVNVKTTVTKEYVDQIKEEVFEKLKKTVQLRGFRKGNGPKHLIEASLGSKLYDETLDRVLPRIMSEVIDEKKYRPVTRLDYKISKLDDSGLEFEASFVNFPEFKLGNVSKIKVKKEAVEVSKEEIKRVVDNMLADDAAQHHHEEKMEADDKWVEHLQMENIKTVVALEEEIKKTLENQKRMGLEDKYNNDVVMEAVKLSNIPVSELLVEKEAEARERDYRARIENLGLNVDDFLKSQKTSIEEMKKQWKEDAIGRIGGEFLLVKIAEEQKFDSDWEKVQAEVDAINDPELKKQYSTPEGRLRVGEVMLRQKALKWLLDQIK